jgi:hypothetical protein
LHGVGVDLLFPTLRHPGGGLFAHPACFAQAPDSRVANYLLVFSTSQSAFNGIYPTVRTSTSTTPVSGSGTVTNNYGGMWNYTYDGAVTTTTTTTTPDDLPYTDTSNTLYVRSYDQHGRQISERWRTITARQGGTGRIRSATTLEPPWEQFT